MSHAAQLVRALRRRWMTWGDLQALRISTSPWKRLAEGGHLYLKDGERIERKTRPDGLVALKVVKG